MTHTSSVASTQAMKPEMVSASPMAVAMMGGIVVATGLTLGFLPALYALWFRVRRAGA